MSREVIVFNRREVPLNILMDELAQRGSPGTWKAMLSSESESMTGWMAGYLYAADGSGTQVTISRETLDSPTLEETIKGYEDLLTEQRRQAFLTATTQYQLTLEPTSVIPDERFLVNTVLSLAQLGDGLIYDISDDQFYEPDNYRAETEH